MNEYYYLVHGGPGSGRYPLGSGERPYQKFEGSRRKSSGGIREYIKTRKEKRAEELKKKSIADAQKRAEEEEKRNKQLEKDKERVLRSGTASEVMKYQGKLTNKELGDAAERLRLEKQLTGYSEQEVKTALDTLKTIQSYSNVGSALAKDGIELWNSFASVYNATSRGKNDPLPIISKGDGKKK